MIFDLKLKKGFYTLGEQIHVLYSYGTDVCRKYCTSIIFKKEDYNYLEEWVNSDDGRDILYDGWGDPFLPYHPILKEITFNLINCKIKNIKNKHEGITSDDYLTATIFCESYTYEYGKNVLSHIRQQKLNELI